MKPLGCTAIAALRHRIPASGRHASLRLGQCKQISLLRRKVSLFTRVFGGIFSQRTSRALAEDKNSTFVLGELNREVATNAADLPEESRRRIIETESVNAQTTSGIPKDLERTPDEIVAELDQYIIGQYEAKRSVAIAMRDRWRRRNIKNSELQKEITPANILLIGPTGSGKTELARRLAQFAGFPFVKVVATRYTEVGFVGEDPSAMIHDLAEQAYVDERKRQMRAGHMAAKIKAEAFLVESLRRTENLKNQPRRLLLSQLRSGCLDEVMVDVNAEMLSGSALGGGASGAASSPLHHLTSLLSRDPARTNFFANVALFANGGAPMGKATPVQLKRIGVGKCLPLLVDHFASENLDEESIVANARVAAEETGIIFIDEFDKLAGTENSSSEFRRKRHGVQSELLALMEGTKIQTRLGRISTTHVLFIASGAFHSSKPTDLMPELQGRLPIRAELNSLTSADFEKILTATKFNLLMQQRELLATEGVGLSFAEDAVRELAKYATELNSSTVNIGARRLGTLMAQLLADIKFNAPKMTGQEIVADGAFVRQRLKDLVKRSDLSKYVL